VLWFVLGYLFFGVAYAAVGAMVSRQEDLATAQAPIIIVITAGILLANMVVYSNPDGTLAQVAAFVPPFLPMCVPARMVVGHMSWLALTAAVALDVLATAGMILLAARIYERSILQTGARVKLTHVLTTRSHRAKPAEPRTIEPQVMKPADTEKAVLSTPKPRLTPFADHTLRVVSVAMVLAGAVIGFSKPVSIVLVAAGALLLALDYGLKNWPRKPAH